MTTIDEFIAEFMVYDIQQQTHFNRHTLLAKRMTAAMERWVVLFESLPNAAFVADSTINEILDVSEEIANLCEQMAEASIDVANDYAARSKALERLLAEHG